MADITTRLRYLYDSGGIDAAIAGQKRLQDSHNNVLASVAKVGAGLAVVGAGAIAAFGVASVKAAIDFESSFAGVRKTVDATEEELQGLSRGIRDLALDIPVDVNELNEIAEAAGQLGVQTDAILGFTRTMADLGVATNLSSLQAAEGLARLANITELPHSQFDRLGSTIVDLGNKLASTEAEILEFGLRIAGAGKIAGLSEANILAIGGAMSSVGIEAEAGGTAVQKVLIGMTQAVAETNDHLVVFAKTAGRSVDDFSRLFKEDAAKAFTEFVEGLGRSGDEAFNILKDLDLNDQRLIRSFLSLANAGDLLNRSIEIGNTAWEENNALTKEAAQRYKTTESQFRLLGNQLREIMMTVGEALLPSVNEIVKTVGDSLKEIDLKSFAEGLAASFREALPQIKEFIQATIQNLPKIIDLFLDLVSAVTKVVKWFLDLPEPIRNISLGFIALSVALAPISGAFGAVSLAVGGLRTAVSLLSLLPLFANAAAFFAPLLAFLGPVGILAIAVGALALAWATDFGGIQTKTKEVVNNVITDIQRLIAAWQGVDLEKTIRLRVDDTEARLRQGILESQGVLVTTNPNTGIQQIQTNEPSQLPPLVIGGQMQGASDIGPLVIGGQMMERIREVFMNAAGDYWTRPAGSYNIPPPGYEYQYPESYQTSPGQFKQIPGAANQPQFIMAHGGEIIGRPIPAPGFPLPQEDWLTRGADMSAPGFLTGDWRRRQKQEKDDWDRYLDSPFSDMAARAMTHHIVMLKAGDFKKFATDVYDDIFTPNALEFLDATNLIIDPSIAKKGFGAWYSPDGNEIRVSAPTSDLLWAEGYHAVFDKARRAGFIGNEVEQVQQIMKALEDPNTMRLMIPHLSSYPDPATAIKDVDHTLAYMLEHVGNWNWQNLPESVHPSFAGLFRTDAVKRPDEMWNEFMYLNPATDLTPFHADMQNLLATQVQAIESSSIPFDFGTIWEGISGKVTDILTNIRGSFDGIAGLFSDFTVPQAATLFAKKKQEEQASQGDAYSYQTPMGGFRAIPGSPGQPQEITAHGGEIIGRPAADLFGAPSVSVSINMGGVTVTNEADEQRLVSNLEQRLLDSLNRILGQGTPWPHGLNMRT